MTAETLHAEGAHDAHEHAHGSREGYLLGFGLSVVLTAIPFGLVMGHVFSDSQAASLFIMAFALIQVIVHMVLFLHMNTKSEGGWTVLALIFTLILVVIAMSGSIWVMYHLDHNMMPMSPADARTMP